MYFYYFYPQNLFSPAVDAVFLALGGGFLRSFDSAQDDNERVSSKNVRIFIRWLILFLCFEAWTEGCDPPFEQAGFKNVLSGQSGMDAWLSAIRQDVCRARPLESAFLNPGTRRACDLGR